jgi:hypothetical protein
MTTVVALFSGCGGGSTQRRQPTLAKGTPRITPADGATAIFRARVTPVLCEYARNLKSAEEQITQASNAAAGPINASAPEGAQTEYAQAMTNLAVVLSRAIDGFRSVTPPAALTNEYESFIASLDILGADATRVARFARKRNYTEIAAMEDSPTPSAGEGVFRRAGITGC